MSQNKLNSDVHDGHQVPPQTANSKKPYKVVLESVTQEKKKLRSTVSYELHAPPGYTFVPVGAPELTEYCKELSRKRGIRVFIASDEPKNNAHRNPNKITHHVHRIGHHFKNDVVDAACGLLGYTNRDSGETASGPAAIARRLDNHGSELATSGNAPLTDGDRKKVAGAIRDLFPKIPVEDQEAIVDRAFKEGTGRVGNAPGLPLARRVQLAVVAHIRHTKTDYDNLIKSAGWQAARKMIEQACLDQIVKWRGEDGEGEDEMEDLFQEVIVLDDDSDIASSGSRDSSVEVISSRAIAEDVVNSRHLDELDVPHPQSSPPEIVHVQPRRLAAPPPVLKRSFRDRWNEARARVGFPTARENRRGAPNEAPSPDVRRLAVSDNFEYYELGSDRNRHLLPPSHLAKNATQWPTQRDGHIDVYPSIEPMEKAAKTDVSDRVPVTHRFVGLDLSNQEPFVPYDGHGTNANRSFFVRTTERATQNEGIDYNLPYDSPRNVEFVGNHTRSHLRRRGAELSTNEPYPQGSKRKQPLGTPNDYRRSSPVYLWPPAKRTRYGDGDGEISTSMRSSEAARQTLGRKPLSRSQGDLRYGLNDQTISYTANDRHDLEFPARAPSSLREFDDRVGVIYIEDENKPINHNHSRRPQLPARGNPQHFNLAERPRLPEATSSNGRAGSFGHRALATQPRKQEYYLDPAPSHAPMYNFNNEGSPRDAPHRVQRQVAGAQLHGSRSHDSMMQHPRQLHEDRRQRHQREAPPMEGYYSPRARPGNRR